MTIQTTTKLRRIVVIDDSAEQRALVVDFLELIERETPPRYTFRIFEAENGMKGLELLRRHRPHLAFLDVDMPRINGINLLNTINDLYKQELGLIPIIMTTAHNDKETVTECIKLGARDYLLKPFDLPDFLKKVKVLL